MQQLLFLAVAVLQLGVLFEILFLLYPMPAALLAPRRRVAPLPPAARSGRIAVLIPAHNEAAVLPATLAALGASVLPPGLSVSAYVVADNATDESASAARSAGATVLARETPGVPSTKGLALGALWREVVRATAPDAVVILDADNHVRPDTLARLWQAYAAGDAEVIQGRRVPKPEPVSTEVSRLDGLTEVCTYRIGCAGRAALGLSVPLMGSGVLIEAARFEALVESPAYGVIEDCEWQALLACEGRRVAYCPEAVVEDQKTARAEALGAQRKRWMSGKAQVVRAYGPRLLRRFVTHADLPALDNFLYLAAPPRVLLVASALGLALAGALLPGAGFWPSAFWGGVLGLGLGGYVVAGLALDGASPKAIARAALMVFQLPRFALQMAGASLTALAGRRVAWERTERSA